MSSFPKFIKATDKNGEVIVIRIKQISHIIRNSTGSCVVFLNGENIHCKGTPQMFWDVLCQ